MSSERPKSSGYFIDLRRRYVNDRTWFGLGFVAIGVGALGPEVTWWLGALVAALGAGPVGWGVVARGQEQGPP